MKKFLKYFIICVCLILLSFLIFWTLSYGVIKAPKKETVTDSFKQAPSEMQQPIELSIDYGDGNEQSYRYIHWKDQVSVFDVLKKATDENNIELDTQEYDFGIFIKSINGFESSAEMAWIYFVNGESGQVAADRKIIGPGDLVEWQYIEPEF